MYYVAEKAKHEATRLDELLTEAKNNIEKLTSENTEIRKQLAETTADEVRSYLRCLDTFCRFTAHTLTALTLCAFCAAVAF